MTLHRRGNNNKNRQFFVPQYECTEDFRAKNIPVEEDLECQVLDQLAANVDFNQNGTDDLTKQLKKARLGKILQDTKLIGEKLNQRKRELYYDWSEKFFNQFAEHFGKLKNVITQLHLNEEQVNKFNQTLDNCLNNLQLSLDQIWNQFKEQKDEQEEA